MQARLSIMRAARQLGEEAGIHLHIRHFDIINEVGAVSIDAALNCEAFASAHSSTSHYDRDSFVRRRRIRARRARARRAAACARAGRPRLAPAPGAHLLRGVLDWSCEFTW